MNTIRQTLLELAERDYKEFQQKLIPTIDGDRVLGVRTPKLRKLAKKLFGSAEAAEFMESLPHEYYEENNLHAFLIEQIKDFDSCRQALLDFLPHVDNWATCDSMTPEIFRKRPQGLVSLAFELINSNHVYTVRYGIGILMKFYLDAGFYPELLDRVAEIRSDEYYVKMMIAWYFQAAVVKQYSFAIKYLAERRLDKWVHNKAIQKCLESRAISDEKKRELKLLKIR